MRTASAHRWLTAQLGLNVIIGYLFVRMLANLYGVSAEKAAFDIAYSVPFLVISLTGFVFFHGGIVKHFSQLKSCNAPDINYDFSAIGNVLFSAGVVGTLISLLLLDPLINVLAPGFSTEATEALRRFFILFIPLIFTTAIFTYLSAVLLAFGVPIAVEASSLLSRAYLVIAFYLFGSKFSLDAVALQLSLWSAAAMALAIILIRRHTSLRYQLCFSIDSPRLKIFFKQVVAFIAVGLLAQLSFVSMRSLASLEGESTVAAFSYAMSVLGPLSLIIGKPLGLAFGTSYISSIYAGSAEFARKKMLQVVLFSGGFSTVATIVIILSSGLIIRLLFGTGAFDEQAVSLTTSLLMLCAFALPALVLMWVLLFPLLGLKDYRAAPSVYFIGYFTHLVLNFPLFYLWGSAGLCWAYVIMNFTQLAFAVYLLRKKSTEGTAVETNEELEQGYGISAASR